MTKKKPKAAHSLAELPSLLAAPAPSPTSPTSNVKEALDSGDVVFEPVPGTDDDALGFLLKEGQVGDIAELPPLMGGMSAEPVLGEVTTVAPLGVTLRLTYFGVHLCDRTITKMKKGYSWR